MAILREDGEYEFFQIQHYMKDKWFASNLDHFGYPNGFRASDPCWQKTGNYGTFDMEQARKGLKWISEKHADYQFRIALITIRQTTTILDRLNRNG